MPLFYIIILSLVQGITEFLPISSSGHLVIVHWFFQGGTLQAHRDQSQVLDIAVHVGTLLAVCVYFYKDLGRLIWGARAPVLGVRSHDRHRGFAVAIGSVPVFAAGLLLHVIGKDVLYNLHVIAWANIGFALLLWWSDKRQIVHEDLEKLTLKHALLIGLMQITALIPGASRSGVTMTAGRLIGFSRLEAARFSLLLSVVAISGAGVLGGLDLLEMQDTVFGLDVLLAMILSCVSAFVAIALMMRWLTHARFTPFVIYRLLLGAVLLAGLYFF